MVWRLYKDDVLQWEHNDEYIEALIRMVYTHKNHSFSLGLTMAADIMPQPLSEVLLSTHMKEEDYQKLKKMIDTDKLRRYSTSSSDA